MLIVKPSATIEQITPDALRLVERAGRTCYQSEPSEGGPEGFIAQVIKRGHLSVLEHASMTVRFVVDRGVSHELVRHRIASYSQESTRYCAYSRERFGGQVTFVEPPGLTDEMHNRWTLACLGSEMSYLELIRMGASAQLARSVLNHSVKTEVVMTANFREWRTVFELRTARDAHPQMREVMIPLLVAARQEVPAVFDDVGVTE